jgi:hypothetical protein
MSTELDLYEQMKCQIELKWLRTTVFAKLGDNFFEASRSCDK